MNDPWSPEIEVSKSIAELMIGCQFPQLKPVTAHVLGEGFDNSVYLVNGQFVFRFPRREMAAGLLETEIRLLPEIAPLLPIPVPNPLFVGTPDEPFPWPFAGYKLLSGVTPTGLTLEQRMQSVEPLAQFLKTLHAFSASEAEKLGVPHDQLGRLNFLKRKPILEANMEKAKGLMGYDEMERIGGFLSSIRRPFTDETKALVHGDLHIRNMLVDEAGRVLAVIDWGDTHIGHPALDLSIVYSFLPPEGRESFFQMYGEVEPEIKRMARFKAIYTLLLLLLYGENRGDVHLVGDCRTALRLALTD
ncbi:phosphotransferase [Neobacillus niacini]|uniref:phosphotransferase n=1 Tax=Neobacillus niacini TaxID=86668 RepID=UPI0021CB3B10|nr:phosphotransferase [Neobacillus niacini]MCM3767670.1 phosphotransferase [Neobacillus niacini]